MGWNVERFHEHHLGGGPINVKIDTIAVMTSGNATVLKVCREKSLGELVPAAALRMRNNNNRSRRRSGSTTS